MLDWTQRDLERYLEIQMDWEFINKEEMGRIPFLPSSYYEERVAKKILNQYAESLFQISASKLGIFYNKKTEKIYKRKNKQFYNLTRTIGHSVVIHTEYTGDKLIKICENIILPRPSKPEKTILRLKKLSQEELAEVMMYIANKEIKIQAVDRI